MSRRSGITFPPTGMFRSYPGMAHGASPSLQAPHRNNWTPLGVMIPFYRSGPLQSLQMETMMGSLMRTGLPSNTFDESQRLYPDSLPFEVSANQRSPSSSEDEEVPDPVVSLVSEVMPIPAIAPAPGPESEGPRKGSRNRKQTKRWSSQES